MPKKKTSVPHCPNCGAPVSGVPAFSNFAKCDYCGSYVDISEWLQKSVQASHPARENRPAPSAARTPAPPRVAYKPEDYIDYKRPRTPLSQLAELVLKYLIAAGFVIFLFALLFGSCFF